MPTQTETAIDPAKTYRAWQSFSSPHGDARLGERFRGSHPIVAALPHLFVADDVPEREWPHELDQAIEAAEKVELDDNAARAAEELQRAKANRLTLPKPAVWRSTRDIQCSRDGQPAIVERGSYVLTDDPLLNEHPDSFKPA